MKISPLHFALSLATSSALFGGEWNQWRGPDRNGVSQDTTPIAETFPEAGLKQVWESEFIPSNEYGGHASPVVSGERVFLSVVWHERVPSDTREIDTEVMQTLNYRGTSPELAKKLEEVCPVNIFRATDSGTEIVRGQLDECVLCELCVEAAPAGAVTIVKKYEQ